ncbi:MAG: hypothetical protein IPL88_08290 [Rhizobiales bacterium]|nr:hypothetical protein [Hyphomicrobiales bacterium]
MTEIVMPAFSAGMEKGRIARWVARAGQEVAAGEIIAEVETDKATMEIEAPQDGVLAEILVPAGKAEIAVATPIARFEPGAHAAAPAAPPEEWDGPSVRLTLRDALRDGLAEEMRRAADLVFLAADAEAGGPQRLGRGLFAEFGARRAVDVATSPAVAAGVALGLAQGGVRVALAYETAAEALEAAPLIAEAAAVGAPVLVLAPLEGALAGALARVPGLAALAPARAADAKGLVKAALRAAGPAALLIAGAALDAEGEVPALGDHVAPLAAARLARAAEQGAPRPGEVATIVSLSNALSPVLEAAGELLAAGIECDVVDLRALAPLDLSSALASLARTNRCVVAAPAALGGVAAEVAARMAKEGFDLLDAPILCVVDGDAGLPMAGRIAQAVREVSYGGADEPG